MGYCDTITHLIREELCFYMGSRLVPLPVVVVVFFSLFFLFVKSFTKITRKCHILFLFFPTKAGVLATELKN